MTVLFIKGWPIWIKTFVTACPDCLQRICCNEPSSLQQAGPSGWLLADLQKQFFFRTSFLLVEGSVPPAIFWHTRTFDLAFPSLMCPTNKTCLVVNINVKQCPKENVPTDSKVQNTITAVSAADSDCEIKWLSAIMGGWGREPAWRASYTGWFF